MRHETFSETIPSSSYAYLLLGPNDTYMNKKNIVVTLGYSDLVIGISAKGGDEGTF